MAEVIVIDSSGDDEPAPLAPPVAAAPPVLRGITGTSAYGLAVLDALQAVAALGEPPKPRSAKATPPPKATPPKRTHAPVERDRDRVTAPKRVTPPPQPPASTSPPPRRAAPRAKLASRKSTGDTRPLELAPLFERVRAREEAAKRTPPPPSHDVVVLSSSDEEEESKSEEEVESDESILESLGIATARSKKKMTMLATMMANEAKTPTPVKRKRLRRFEGAPAVERETAASPPVQRPPPPVAGPKVTRRPSSGAPVAVCMARRENQPNETKKTKTTKGKARRRQRRPLFRSIEAKPRRDSSSDFVSESSSESGAFESPSSDMESLPTPPRSQPSSEEEWSLPPIRAGAMPGPMTCRKSAPTFGASRFGVPTSGSFARSSSRVFPGDRYHRQVVKKSAPDVSRRVSASRAMSGEQREPVTSSPPVPAAAKKTTSPFGRGLETKKNADVTPPRQRKSREQSSAAPGPRRVETGNHAEETPSPARMQGNEESEDSSPLKRSRRQLEPQFNADRIALKDIQAQEVELARIKAQRAMLASFSAANSTSGAKREVDASVPVDLCSSSDDSDFVSDGAATSPSTSTTADSPTKPAAQQVETAASSRATATTIEVAREPRRMRKRQNPSVPSPIARATWAGRSPVNLLDDGVGRPYDTPLAEPLSIFDASGELESRCAFVNKASPAYHVAFSSYLSSTSGQSSQEQQASVDVKVRNVLAACVPIIKRCFAKRSSTIIVGSRATVQAQLRSLARHRAALVRAAAEMGGPGAVVLHLDGGVLESKVESRSCATRIFLGRGESTVVERRIGQLAVIISVPLIESLSRSVTCIGVARNVRVDDDPILRFLATPTDSADQSSQTVVPAVTTDRTGEFDLAPTAIDDEVTEFALRAVIAECGDSDQVYQALKTVASLSQPYTDYSTLKQKNDALSTAQKRITDAMTFVMRSRRQSAGMRGVELLKSTCALKPWAAKCLAERLAPPPTYFESQIVRWKMEQQPNHSPPLAATLNVRRTKEYRVMAESYRDFFCRICYCYDCQEHGIEQPQPTRRVDPLYPRLRSQMQAHDEAVVHSDESEEQQESDVEMSATQSAYCIDVESDDSVDLDDDEYGTDVIDVETSESEEAERHEAARARRSRRSVTVAATTATSNWVKQEQSRRRREARLRAQHVFDSTEYIDPSHATRYAAKIQRLLENESGCGSACWKSVDALGVRGPFDPTMLVFVEKLARLLGAHACLIAAMAEEIPCRAIKAMLSELKKRESDRAEWLDDRTHRSKKDSRAQSSRGSTNRELLARTRNQRLVDKGSNRAYEPCNHEGPCDSTACSCVRRDHMCDRACACPRDCPNRLQGCKCSLGACRTVGCPCFAAGRECDPDQCVTCGASEVALLPFLDLVQKPPRSTTTANSLGGRSHTCASNSAGPANQVSRSATCANQQTVGTARMTDQVSRSATCANVHLQRGSRQKIAIGLSGVHGWGAFASAEVRRGEFISEYPGELISQDEAERRGAGYDRVATSYFFDLNEDAVVDAIRVGNKSRFINHGKLAQANCHAKVVRVGPEHRITIWAKRDIKMDEELFFDYGYKTESAPGWSSARLGEELGQRGNGK